MKLELLSETKGFELSYHLLRFNMPIYPLFTNRDSVTHGREGHVNVDEVSDSSNGILRAHEKPPEQHRATHLPFFDVLLEDDHQVGNPITTKEAKGEVSAA